MGRLLIVRDHAHTRVRSFKLRHSQVDALDDGTVDLLHWLRETLEQLNNIEAFLL